MSSSPVPAAASDPFSDKASALGETPSADVTTSEVKEPSDLMPSVVKDPSVDVTQSGMTDLAAAQETKMRIMRSLGLEEMLSQKKEPPSAAVGKELSEGTAPSGVKNPAAAQEPSPGKMQSLHLEEKSSPEEEPPSPGLGKELPEGTAPSVVKDPAAAQETSLEKMPPLNPKEMPTQKEEAPSAALEKELSSEGTTPSADKTLAAPLAARFWRPSHILGLPDPKGVVLFMVVTSVLYALVTPWLLRCVAEQPSAFVWTASQLAVSYFSIGTICFSTIRFSTVFFRISYIELLSVAATHFIGTNSGAAVVNLLSFYAAGMFGYALGEYLQRNQSTNEVHVPLARAYHDPWSFIFMHGLMSFTFLLRMVSLILYPPSVLIFIAVKNHGNVPLCIVTEFSLEMILLVWPWSCFVSLVVQKESIMSPSMMLYKIPVWAAVFYALGTVFSAVGREIASVLTLWSVAIAIVALFGYILAMFGRAKKIIKREQSLPNGINKPQG